MGYYLYASAVNCHPVLIMNVGTIVYCELGQ